MKIQLITEDFKDSDYDDNYNCPLAKALKRLNYDFDWVGGTSIVKGGCNVAKIPNGWDINLVNPMIRKANNYEPIEFELDFDYFDLKFKKKGE